MWFRCSGDLSRFRTRPEHYSSKRRRSSSASPQMTRRVPPHPTRRRRILAPAVPLAAQIFRRLKSPSSIRRSSARPFPASHPAGRRGVKNMSIRGCVATSHPPRGGIQCSARTAAASSLITVALASHPVAMPDKDAAAARARALPVAHLRSRPYRWTQTCLPACWIRTRYHHSRREP